MKSLCISISIIFLFFTYHLPAQTITGYVKKNSGGSMELITILLLKAKDSSLVKGAVTDVQGKYEFSKIASGTYFISANGTGFSKTSTPVFDFNGNNYTVDSIVLKQSIEELKSVTVTSTRPLIQIQADKLIFNVEGSVNSTGLTALELLQKSPGVQVDQDDNILVEGKQGVKIYIDGKPSPLAGRDLAAVLKSMQSSDIEAIEIITNPSAKYDAAGNVGIINIRLKKNKKLGTNGNLTINPYVGITPKINLSGSLNYRNKKWNLFGNYSIGQGIWHNTRENDKILNNVAYNTASKSEWRDKYQNFKAGADYSLNSKNSLGIVINGSNSDHSSVFKSETGIGNDTELVPDSAILTSSSKAPGPAQYHYLYLFHF